MQDELKRFDDELDLRRKRFEEEMSSHVKIAQEERDKLVEEVHALKEQKTAWNVARNQCSVKLVNWCLLFQMKKS